MSFLNLVIEEKVLDNRIKALKEKRSNLEIDINQIIEIELRKKFPDKNYNTIYNSRSKEIDKMKKFLYRKYRNRINFMISGLQDIKNEIEKEKLKDLATKVKSWLNI